MSSPSCCPAVRMRDAEALARRVLQTVSSTLILVTPGVTATITLSIGVAVAAPSRPRGT